MVQNVDENKSSPVDEKKEGAVTSMPVSEDQAKRLVAQIQKEYTEAMKELEPRFAVMDKRLKLYNNQKKDAKSIGIPLLFTTHDTLLASLYDDRMGVKFVAREEGDSKVEEGLNALAEYDYEEMGKAALDYQQLWDALMYSYGIIDMTTFDWDEKRPKPRIVDPLTFIYDPRGESPDGDENGNEAMRYCGVTMRKTMRELKKEEVYFNLDRILTEKELNDRQQQSTFARSEAQGTQYTNVMANDTKDNVHLELLEWRTWFDGVRVIATVANRRKELVRYTEMKGDSWGFNVKRVWKKAHQFPGSSVADLVEDKQRGMAVLINAAFKAIKSDVEPNYVYAKGRLINNKDILKPGFNKHIAVKGDSAAGAVEPFQKASVNYAAFTNMLNFFDVESQKATSTPELQQGVIGKEARTLGELNIVAQKVDTRYSLLVKQLMQGEKEFWQRWYWMYKTYFEANVSEKVLRLTGTGTTKFRKLTRENIIAENADPDVRIESKILTDAQQMKQYSRLLQFSQIASADPSIDKRYLEKKTAKAAGFTNDEIDSLFPMTYDEDIATSENDMLNEDKLVQIEASDNHTVHIRIHREANANKSSYSHIQAHREALRLQRVKPETTQGSQNQMATMDQGGTQPGQGGVLNAAGANPAIPNAMANVTPSQVARQ